MDALEKPARKLRREVLPDGSAWELFRRAIKSEEFGRLVDFIHATGCRPGEAFGLEARHIDLDRGVAVLPGKQTRATGRQSVLPLSDDLLTWLAPLIAERPMGPLFRTARGNAWTKDAVNCQVRRARARLGVGKESGLTVYALRHLFATDALDRDVPVATVSTLLNHGDTRMVMQHYAHLADRHDHLRDAVALVRPRVSVGPCRPPRPARTVLRVPRGQAGSEAPAGRSDDEADGAIAPGTPRRRPPRTA
jgi:integrase